MFSWGNHESAYWENGSGKCQVMNQPIGQKLDGMKARHLRTGG